MSFVTFWGQQIWMTLQTCFCIKSHIWDFTVFFFLSGVGFNVDIIELRSIASDPKHSRLYQVKYSSSFPDIIDDLATNLCTGKQTYSPAQQPWQIRLKHQSFHPNREWSCSVLTAGVTFVCVLTNSIIVQWERKERLCLRCSVWNWSPQSKIFTNVTGLISIFLHLRLWWSIVNYQWGQMICACFSVQDIHVHTVYGHMYH